EGVSCAILLIIVDALLKKDPLEVNPAQDLRGSQSPPQIVMRSASVPEGPGRHSGDRFEHFGKVALALVTNRRRDLADRQRRLQQKFARAFNAQVGQIDMRSKARDSLEQMSEMVFRKIGGRSYLFQVQLPRIVVMHEFDCPSKPAIDRPGARKLYR